MAPTLPVLSVLFAAVLRKCRGVTPSLNVQVRDVCVTLLKTATSAYRGHRY